MDSYEGYKYYKAKYKKLKRELKGGSSEYTGPNIYQPYLGTGARARNLALHPDNIRNNVSPDVEGMKQSILEKAKHIHHDLQEVSHLLTWLNHFDAIQDAHSGRGNKDYGESVNQALLNDSELWEKIKHELEHANPHAIASVRSKKYGKNLLHGLLMANNPNKLKETHELLKNKEDRNELLNNLSTHTTLNERGELGNTPLQSKAKSLKFPKPDESEEEARKREEHKAAAENSHKDGNLDKYMEFQNSQLGGFWAWLGLA